MRSIRGFRLFRREGGVSHSIGEDARRITSCTVPFRKEKHLGFDNGEIVDRVGGWAAKFRFEQENDNGYGRTRGASGTAEEMLVF